MNFLMNLPNRLIRSISPAAASVYMRFSSAAKMIFMETAPNTSETLLMEDFMDEFADRVMNDICDAINEYARERKNHHLEVEISLAWDDEDEFEHEGYYHSIDDAINALISLKNMEKELQEGNL